MTISTQWEERSGGLTLDFLMERGIPADFIVDMIRGGHRLLTRWSAPGVQHITHDGSDTTYVLTYELSQD